MRKTKIIVTLGPSSASYTTFKELALAGLNVARINFSHGNIEEHQKAIDVVKKVRDELNMSISIMVDIRGPEVRVKTFKEGFIDLKTNSQFKLYNFETIGDENGVSVTEPDCLKHIPLDTVILANDGLIETKVISQDKDGTLLKIISGGILKNNKGITFKGYTPKLPYISIRDEKDLVWAFKNECDYIAASFVTKKEDVLELKELIKKHHSNCKIIAKIESLEGVNNLHSILEECHGIMVARGDLGVEVPLSKLPAIQSKLIHDTKLTGKITIVATEMLESMIHNIRPTRAEVQDVATAVIQGASAVMLSAETSVGDHPVKVVSVMGEIAEETERSINYKEAFDTLKWDSNDITDCLTYSAVNSSFQLSSKAILVYTSRGKMAGFVARFLPNCPIIAITDEKQTFHDLSLLRDVTPYYLESFDENKIFETARTVSKDLKLVNAGDNVVVITGTSDLHKNIMKITTF